MGIKKILNWKAREVVNIYDEVTIWSAPFGRLLLENIPMIGESKIVDIGFGTGFPLIELSQRFGDTSKIYGIDIWKEAINRTREKIDILELRNIEIIEDSATRINIDDQQIDLVTSNLGVNNFEEKEKVYSEIKRILKKGGKLCITTNPIGTFEELFEVFKLVLSEMELVEQYMKLKEYVDFRNTEEDIVSELDSIGLRLIKVKKDYTNIRFIEGQAVLNHSLIRIGFRESWSRIIGTANENDFYKRVIQKIDDTIILNGEFKITIPMLYLEFEK